MSATRKLERHINLIALLLDTRRPLPVGEIKRKIPDYAQQTDDTFHRTFERDKAELREQGLLIETEDVDGFGVETGYRIKGSEALLDDPGFTPVEMAALSLAMQAWGGTGGEDAALGFLKLSAVAGTVEHGPTAWVLPRVDVDRTVAALMDALVRRKRVTFRYRVGGAGEATERRVDPHGLYHRGAWYLVGFDHAREDVRRFKVARIDGKVEVADGREPDFEPPPKADLEVPRGPWEGEERTRARVAFAPEAAWWVERRTGAERAGEHEGWPVLDLPVAVEIDDFAGWVCGFADRAVVLEPAALREAVVARLRAASGEEG